MLSDEIIARLAEETVQSLGELDESFREELFGIAKKTIEAECRKRVLKNLDRIAISKLHDYLYESSGHNESCRDSIAEFLKDSGVNVVNESVGEVYLSYSVFCRENNLQALSKIHFSKEIQKRANVISTTTSIDGRSIRIFKPV